MSLILPPKSGRIPIASFCVEQGRWSARGKEDVKTFATASAVVPSREAKIAMKAPMPAPAADPAPTGGAAGTPHSDDGDHAASETGERQQEVWRKVRKVQDGLSSNLGTTVNAARLAEQPAARAGEREAAGRASRPTWRRSSRRARRTRDVIGYVFAVNGKLNSAEIYPSNGLFRKMWPKLLKASVTEAIGQKNAGGEATPSRDAALAFLDDAIKGAASVKTLTADVRLETRSADKAFYFETRRASGAWVHRSYLAK